jgi:thioredoxin 1
MIKHVETERFDEEIKEGVTLVDFYADWCGPCKMMAPILEDLEKKKEDIKIIKVNVDVQSDLGRIFNIMSIPTLILFKEGRVVSKNTGFMSMDMITDCKDQNK